MTLHENGPWYLNNGIFTNRYVPEAHTDNPAIYIDMDEGTLLKAGDANMVESYAATHIDRLLKYGFNKLAKGLTVIQFKNHSETHLTADEICTLMNYLGQTLGKETVNKLFQMPETELKNKLQKLQNIGL